jgi:hypothetical protein
MPAQRPLLSIEVDARCGTSVPGWLLMCLAMQGSVLENATAKVACGDE